MSSSVRKIEGSTQTHRDRVVGNGKTGKRLRHFPGRRKNAIHPEDFYVDPVLFLRYDRT